MNSRFKDQDKAEKRSGWKPEGLRVSWYVMEKFVASNSQLEQQTESKRVFGLPSQGMFSI